MSFGFSAGDAKRLGKIVKAVERRPLNPPFYRGRYPTGAGGSGAFPVVLTSTLTAKSGTTPGTGTGHPQTYDGSVLGTDTGTSLTILSNYSTSIASGKLIWVVAWAGALWLLTADCS
jgi:hypothetical protein